MKGGNFREKMKKLMNLNEITWENLRKLIIFSMCAGFN